MSEPKPILAAGSKIRRVASPSSVSIAQPSTHQTISNPRSTPLSLPRLASEDDWHEGVKPSPTVSGLPSLTREEKAAEMARKKDERKQVWIIISSFYNVL